jgi:hypothetical protein
MRSVNQTPDDMLVECPKHAGGCGARFRYAEVKHREVPTRTTRDPATGEQLVVAAEASCPRCGFRPLIMPGGKYTA